jgi:hypothetical protein
MRRSTTRGESLDLEFVDRKTGSPAVVENRSRSVAKCPLAGPLDRRLAGMTVQLHHRREVGLPPLPSD